MYSLDVALLLAIMAGGFQYVGHQFVLFAVAGTIFECGVSRPSSFGHIRANWLPLVLVFLLFEVELLFLVPISLAVGCGLLRMTVGLVGFLGFIVFVFVVEWRIGAFVFHS